MITFSSGFVSPFADLIDHSNKIPDDFGQPGTRQVLAERSENIRMIQTRVDFFPCFPCFQCDVIFLEM